MQHKSSPPTAATSRRRTRVWCVHMDYAFYSPSAAALSSRSPCSPPRKTTSHRACAQARTRILPLCVCKSSSSSCPHSAVRHTTDIIRVSDLSSFRPTTSTSVAWLRGGIYIYIRIVYFLRSPFDATVLYVSPRYSPPCALAPNSRFGRRNRRKCLFFFFCCWFHHKVNLLVVE